MWLKVLESVLVWVFLFFVCYEVLIPAVQGRPLFPMFRKLPKVKEELAQANEEHDVAVIKQQVKKVRSKTTKKEL